MSSGGKKRRRSHSPSEAESLIDNQSHQAPRQDEACELQPEAAQSQDSLQPSTSLGRPPSPSWQSTVTFTRPDSPPPQEAANLVRPNSPPLPLLPEAGSSVRPNSPHRPDSPPLPLAPATLTRTDSPAILLPQSDQSSAMEDKFQSLEIQPMIVDPDPELNPVDAGGEITAPSPSPDFMQPGDDIWPLPEEPDLDSLHHQRGATLTDEDKEKELEGNIFEDMYSFSDEDPPIYSGAPITLHESLVAILTLALTYSLSGSLVQAILQLIQLHCIKEGNVLKQSLFLFKKYFSYIKGAVDYQYYCSVCFMKCVRNSDCSSCKKRTPMCCLIRIPLIPQLQTLFKRKGFFSKLRNGNTMTSSANGISDIHTGALYKELLQKGLLGLPNISFLWYTDGAALFKSSKISVWPLFLTINELSYSERYKKENVLVPALWCGPVQPHGNFIIDAAHPELSQLYNGVKFEIEGQGEKVVKAVVLGGTADSPARAKMLHMVNHNGENSCQKCEQPGECREGVPGVRIFPYKPEEMKERTDESALRYSRLALALKRPYMGFKGCSDLKNITYSMTRSTSIDSMHQIFAGCSKKHLKFFFDSKFSHIKGNIAKSHRGTINEKLLSIKPPHFMTRVPSSLEDYATWKTVQHKYMCIYYGLPVMHGIVRGLPFKHYATLVAAVQYLNSDCVTPEDLVKADRLIIKYMSYFEDLCDKNFMTLNFHLLLHLVQLVKEMGALWVTSCFNQEGLNAVILNLVHGTRYAEVQIASSILTCLGLTDLVDNLKEGDSKSFCKNLMATTKDGIFTKVGDSTIVGTWKKLETIPQYLEETLHQSVPNNSNIYSFHCLRREKEGEKCLYVAESYTRSETRDSSSVLFSENNDIHVGLLKMFVRTAECTCVKCSCDCSLFAVIQKLEIAEYLPTLIPDIPVPITHIYNKTSCFVMKPVTSLRGVCVKMELDNKLFIAKRCNTYEIE